jgi:hypothetical protein
MTYREKTLFSFLAVTVFACGVSFLIMNQVEQYDREKIWDDLDTTMPKHKIRLHSATTSPVSSLKNSALEGFNRTQK